MNKRKTIATAIIGLIILILLILLWIFVFKNIVTDILSNQPEQASTTQEYIPSEKPLTVEQKKEVLDELLPENLVDTEEEIERRQAQLEALQNLGGQSEQDTLNQLQSLSNRETE